MISCDFCLYHGSISPLLFNFKSISSVLREDQILQAVESMKAARARERQMDVVDFSLANLRKEQRREYELSDPDAKKKYVMQEAYLTGLYDMIYNIYTI